MSERIVKFVAYPSYVWEDVTKFVLKKYGIMTPRGSGVGKFIYSFSFNYHKFIQNINEKKAMVLFSLISRKLGIRFIQDSNGWSVLPMGEFSEQALKFTNFEPKEIKVQEVTLNA